MRSNLVLGINMKSKRIHAWLLVMVASVLIAVQRTDAQNEPKPLVATSSDLSSALTAGEWSRVKKAVDAGLSWLASQQAADGRFPSKPVAQPAITSMAIMAFLSRGHVPDQGRYGKQIT